MSENSKNQNRTWLVFANEEKCKHVRCLDEKGFISWHKGSIKFAEGDTVYIFISTERRVRYKTKVVAVDVDREDASYWIEKAPKDKTHRLQRVEKCSGIGLHEKDLQMYGFKGGRSLQHPMCGNLELLNYIEDCFQKTRRVGTVL